MIEVLSYECAILARVKCDRTEKVRELKLVTTVGQIELLLSKNDAQDILDMKDGSKVSLDHCKGRGGIGYVYVDMHRENDQISMEVNTESIQVLKLSFSLPRFLQIIQELRCFKRPKNPNDRYYYL